MVPQRQPRDEEEPEVRRQDQSDRRRPVRKLRFRPFLCLQIRGQLVFVVVHASVLLDTH